MYSVTIYRLLFSSTITPSNWTRFSCRSCLKQTDGITQKWLLWVCPSVWNTNMTSFLRHDRRFSDEGLRRSVVFYALHSNFCPSVIPNHDVWKHNQSWLHQLKPKRLHLEVTHLQTLLFQWPAEAGGPFCSSTSHLLSTLSLFLGLLLHRNVTNWDLLFENSSWAATAPSSNFGLISFVHSPSASLV